jgi:hypothetical protein
MMGGPKIKQVSILKDHTEEDMEHARRNTNMPSRVVSEELERELAQLDEVEAKARAERETVDLVLLLELLEPYFVTRQTTVEQAVTALRARLESGDQAEQERYEKLMIRGLKLKFGPTGRSRRHRSATEPSS